MAAGPREEARGGADGGFADDQRGRLDAELIRIGGLAQSRSDLTEACGVVLTEVAPLVNAQVGACFLAPVSDGGPAQWRRSASYGLVGGERQDVFSAGEGVVGQAAVSGQTILLTEVPAGYLPIRSGTGHAGPATVVVQPVLFEDETLAVLEFGSLTPFSDLELTFLERIAVALAGTINLLRNQHRTEQLLEQSRRLVRHLREQLAELRHTRDDLADQVQCLTEQNRTGETRNLRIDSVRRELEQQVQRYAQLTRTKSAFLANARGELRDVDALVGPELLAWLDDVLDLAAVDGTGDRAHTVRLPLSQVRRHLEQSCRPWAQATGLPLRVHITEDTPEYLVTDPERLLRLLCTLLADRTRRTPSGGSGDRAHGPSITLRIEPSPPGIGFDVPALDTAERVLSFTVSHSGLGLAVSRELARVLGGRITVNQNSTCTLYLPQECPPGEAPNPVALTPVLRASPVGGVSPVRGLDGSTVLIIDNDVRTVFALTSALELHGLEVFYADSTADGLRILAEHPEVDVVLMDASLPDLDGSRTTRAIRKLPGAARLPVIFLTAKAMPCGREFSVAAGATDCITTPVDLDELLAALSTWVQRFRDRSEGE